MTLIAQDQYQFPIGGRLVVTAFDLDTGSDGMSVLVVTFRHWFIKGNFPQLDIYKLQFSGLDLPALPTAPMSVYGGVNRANAFPVAKTSADPYYASLKTVTNRNRTWGSDGGFVQNLQFTLVRHGVAYLQILSVVIPSVRLQYPLDPLDLTDGVWLFDSTVPPV